MPAAMNSTDTITYKGSATMRIEISEEMRDYYNTQLAYACSRMEQVRAAYKEWDNAAYMEDSPGLAITYTARAGIAHDEFLFWTSVVSSLKRKLKDI